MNERAIEAAQQIGKVENALEAAKRMRQTFDVTGDRWFQVAADELERLAALPPLRAREEIAQEVAKIVDEPLGDGALAACDYMGDEAADDLRKAITRALSRTAGQEWRDILPRVIVHLEDGEGHDEGAFDESCDTCLLLRDLRVLLPASPVAEPIVADKRTGAE